MRTTRNEKVGENNTLHLRVVRAKRDFTGVFLLVGAYLNHKLHFEAGFRS